MLTPHKLERLWRDNLHRRIMREVLAGRPEAGFGLDERLGGWLAAAALTLLRLGELNQTGQPLADDLRKRLLIAKNADGSFGDGRDKPILTALCVRALAALPHGPATPRMSFGLTGFGGDVRGGDRAVAAAVDAGVAYLADSQHPDGGWGVGGDAATVAFDTGFVLLQLGRLDVFRQSVRVDDALQVPLRTRLADAASRAVWSLQHLRGGRTLEVAARPRPPVRAPQPFIFAEVA